MFKKLDAWFKRCDEFMANAAKATVARHVQEVKQERFDRIKTELQLLESLQRQNMSLSDAIANRRFMLRICEEELKPCDIYA